MICHFFFKWGYNTTAINNNLDKSDLPALMLLPPHAGGPFHGGEQRWRPMPHMSSSLQTGPPFSQLCSETWFFAGAWNFLWPFKSHEKNRETCSVKMEEGELIHFFPPRIFLGISFLKIRDVSPNFASWGHSSKNNSYIIGHGFCLPLRTLYFKENSCTNANAQRHDVSSSHTDETALLVIFVTYIPNRERRIISSCCQKQPQVQEHNARKKQRSFHNQQIMMDPQLFGKLELSGYPRTKDLLSKVSHKPEGRSRGDCTRYWPLKRAHNLISSAELFNRKCCGKAKMLNQP